MDSQRATILFGGFIAILFVPEINLLPFDWGYLWYLLVLLVYTPFYIGYMKLNVVSPGDLELTRHQTKRYVSYANKRRRFDLIGRILLWGGVFLFLLDMFVSVTQPSEIISVLAIVGMSIGLGLLALTRCPFCNKITVRAPLANGGRCINCHRDIDGAD